ncbi:MAG: glycosyltransferase [Candidatus Berkelbacteria bacterium]|nr:glycosyltransferase [Candidatus Berkelbacteria bacterium]
MNDTKEPKVAFVCDFLTKFGGAQQVLLAMHETFPDAPIYCLLYDEKGTLGKFKKAKIIPSRLQNSILSSRPKYLLPKFAAAVEEFDLSKFDIVISSSDSFAHGAITKPSTFHLCYCHTPMRYAWDWNQEYLVENHLGFGIKGLIVRKIIHELRLWDRAAADRVDHWLANAENVKKRIAKYYKAEADVLYPPIDLEGITPNNQPPLDSYLIVSRIEPYKKIRLAVEAFNESGKELIIIGEGSQKEELEDIAKDNIKFLGSKYGNELYPYFQQAKAFLFPGEDDFGITPVESMAAGRPVVAFKKGGTLETVIEGQTGVFFDRETSASLNSAIVHLEENFEDFTPAKCRKQAENFSKELFQEKLKKEALEGYKQYKSTLDIYK